MVRFDSTVVCQSCNGEIWLNCCVSELSWWDFIQLLCVSVVMVRFDSAVLCQRDWWDLIQLLCVRVVMVRFDSAVVCQSCHGEIWFSCCVSERLVRFDSTVVCQSCHGEIWFNCCVSALSWWDLIQLLCVREIGEIWFNCCVSELSWWDLIQLLCVRVVMGRRKRKRKAKKVKAGRHRRLVCSLFHYLFYKKNLDSVSNCQTQGPHEAQNAIADACTSLRRQQTTKESSFFYRLYNFDPPFIVIVHIVKYEFSHNCLRASAFWWAEWQCEVKDS